MRLHSVSGFDRKESEGLRIFWEGNTMMGATCVLIVEKRVLPCFVDQRFGVVANFALRVKPGEKGFEQDEPADIVAIEFRFCGARGGPVFPVGALVAADDRSSVGNLGAQPLEEVG